MQWPGFALVIQIYEARVIFMPLRWITPPGLFLLNGGINNG